MSDDKSGSVVVELPSTLVRLFPGSEERVEVSASTVAEMLDALNRRWPGMRDRLCDSSPRIRRNINIFVEGKRATLETGLKPGGKAIVRMAMIG